MRPDDFSLLAELLRRIRGALAIIAGLLVGCMTIMIYWLAGMSNEPGWAKFTFVTCGMVFAAYLMRIIDHE